MGRAWSGDLELSIYQNLRHQQIPSGAFDTTLADPRASNEDQRGAFELRYEPALSRTSRLYTRVWLDTYQFEGNYPYGPRSVYHDRWTGAWVGAEPRLVVRPRKSVELTVGGELRAALVSELTSRVGDEVFLDEDPGQSSFAGYAILGLIGQGARLTLGGRYDWFTLSGVGALSPRAALLLTPGEDDVIKLLYGTAFRAPSPYELFYNDDGATQIPPASLSPEQVQTVEVGHDHQFSPRWQSSTGAYWSGARAPSSRCSPRCSAPPARRCWGARPSPTRRPGWGRSRRRGPSRSRAPPWRPACAPSRRERRPRGPRQTGPCSGT
jgi:outer membrane receptor protein involved in Fe transport